MNKVKIYIKRTLIRVVDYINLLIYHISFYDYYNKKKIISLHNKYKNQIGFVVCNGPSLTPADLTKIYSKGIFTVGMNNIARLYDKTPWRVNILICTDDSCFSKNNIKLIQKCQAEYKVFDKRKFLKSFSFKGNKLYVTVDGSRSLLDSPKFSENIEDKIYAIGTTAYEAIEWSRYVGINNIYMIGCDMSYRVNKNRDGSIYYNNSGKDHFYDNIHTNKDNIKPVETWEQKNAHRAADNYSKMNGFRIYNATRGGCLEEYERVDFDNLL